MQKLLLWQYLAKKCHNGRNMEITERVYEGVMTMVGMNVLQKQPRSGGMT